MSLQWKFFSSEIEYSSTLQKMEKKVDSIIKGESDEEIWMLEHQEVYTAGTSSKQQDLISSNSIPVLYAGRGGQYTYHGPGQRVVYFMLDLKHLFAPENPDLRKFIFLLEQLIIDTLEDFGIKGERRKNRVGIWVVHDNIESKIAAIGIRIRKWTSFHGIAINVNPDLNNFKGIIPCGIREFGVCSMESIGKKITLKELDNRLKCNFYNIFKNYRDEC